MSDETRVIKVEKEPGLLLGNVWVPVGKSAAVDRTKAETLIREKACSAFDGTPDFANIFPEPTKAQLAKTAEKEAAKLNKPASELIDFPAYAQLNKGGLTTVEQLKKFIADKPNDWQTELVLTDEDVAAIQKKLKPAAKSKE